MTTVRGFPCFLSISLCAAVFAAPAAADGEAGSRVLFAPTAEGSGFVSDGPGASRLIVEASALTFEPGDGGPPLRMHLAGASGRPRLAGVGPVVRQRHVFRGPPEAWRVGVPQYAAVRAVDVYPGIDFVVRGDGGRWEYDFVVAPGADPSRVLLRFAGAEEIAIGSAGDLVLNPGRREVRHRRPSLHQEISGRRTVVAGGFERRAEGLYGFRVGRYDRRLPLVIDPEILFVTEGGASGDRANAVAVDAAGAAYVTGFEAGIDSDVFVTKVDASGATVWTAVFGGEGFDMGTGIAVDAAGSSYLTGQTGSVGFPVTPDALQPTYGDPDTEQDDAFLVKLDAQGAITYSTFLGGNTVDQGTGIALDAAGNVYLTGETDSFDPLDPFPLVAPIPLAQPPTGLTAYLIQFDPSFTPIFSTLIEGAELGWGVVVDAAGDVYVAGETAYENLPAAGGFQPSLGSLFQVDGFVVKLRPATSELLWATYLGGTQQDGILALAVDGAGHALVTGLTSSPDFPVAQPFQAELAHSATYDAFVTKLAPGGASLVYSTFLGGTVIDSAYGIAVDAAGNALVTGETWSAGEFPTLRATQRVFGGGPSDAFLAKLDPAGVPIYSTYLGDDDAEIGFAVALDAVGEPRVAGGTPNGWFLLRLDGSYTYNPAPTPTEEGLVVEPEDETTQTKPVTLTFANVTTEGETSLATGTTGPAPPAGFQLGEPATYYELSTTATFEGTVEVCIRYGGVSFADESELTLQHFESGAWVDVTTSLDTAADVICGVVTTLSPFALFEPAAGESPLVVTFLSPLDTGGDRTFRAGRTVPLRFRLTTSDGAPVSGAEARPRLDLLVGSVETEVAVPASPANPDGLFRSSPDEPIYVFNLSTRGLEPGAYRLRVELGDGGEHEVPLTLR